MSKGFVERVAVWFPAPKACIGCHFYLRAQHPIADECGRFGYRRIGGEERLWEGVRTGRPDWCIALDDKEHAWWAGGYTAPVVISRKIEQTLEERQKEKEQ
jgi:hypothetical protein